MLKDKLAAVVSDLRNGKIVIVTDDAHRENEGDLVMAAQYATCDTINFMAREGRGLICVPLSSFRASRLGLELMVKENSDPFKTKFTVSVDYKHGTTTGISMADRALTIRSLADDSCEAADFARPGHVFPLIADDEGLKRRRGHTEATLELLRMAGLKEVGVICEIINDDGTMARESDLDKFAFEHGLEMISIENIFNSLS